MYSVHQIPTRTATATAYWHIGIVIIAIALCPVATRALSTPTMPTSSTKPNKNIVAITHAAGRMGKALALQIREDAELTRMPRDSLPTIKAIVRSEAEATSVQCDLGGVTLIGGKVAPIPLDWLETVVVEDVEGDEGRKLLQEAFEGAGAAILCDASHNEMVWQNENNDAITNQDDREVCSISVPASENKDLSQRLLAEIEAASHSSTLRHVVMRSSMGLFVDTSSEAAQAMGGEAALAGPRKAEEALRSTGLDHTILRLGALTDDAGMIPLIFGIEDSILEKRNHEAPSYFVQI